EAMDRLVDYEIADVTAAATYYLAETYFDFSRALAESERPADLQPEDLTAYEEALDEQAFPFEEKAIATHKKNLELMQKGVVSPWIEKSLGRHQFQVLLVRREDRKSTRLNSSHDQI